MRNKPTKTCIDCGQKVHYCYATRCKPCYIKIMPTAKERLFSRVNKSENCWLWNGPKDRAGYGHMGFMKKTMSVHRVSWILENGRIPLKKCVLHKCDTRNCVRPSHLMLGSQLENISDCKKKGRNAFGSRHSKAIMDEESVREIRRLHIPWDRKNSIPKLAERFGISKESAYQIIYRRTWKHVI